MANALITIEGVLAGSRTTQERIVASAPIPSGRALYEALGGVWRLIMITAESNRAEIDRFLAVEGLNKHAEVLTTPSWIAGEPLEEITAHHLGRARSEGTVGLLVTPSPKAAAMAMHAGVPTVLFIPPTYARPEFRPDFEKEPRPWDEIEAEVNNQRVLRARDTRLEGV